MREIDKKNENMTTPTQNGSNHVLLSTAHGIFLF